MLLNCCRCFPKGDLFEGQKWPGAGRQYSREGRDTDESGAEVNYLSLCRVKIEDGVRACSFRDQENLRYSYTALTLLLHCAWSALTLDGMLLFHSSDTALTQLLRCSM
jgi:hypothetical protein